VKVFVDTSALLAILDEDDRHHAEAAETFRALAVTADLVTHNYVEVETLALVRRRLGREAVVRLTDGILPALATIWVDEPLHDVALAVHRAAGSSASLVDQVSFEIMRREGIVDAFAFDADFEGQGFRRAIAPRPREQGRRLSEALAPYSPDSDQRSDLVSVAEIAARAARPVNTIQSWRRRHPGFPEPVASLATGPVWTWPDVDRWIRDRAAPRRSSVAG
jgi:predicted nucleic acid-binding protein